MNHQVYSHLQEVIVHHTRTTDMSNQDPLMLRDNLPVQRTEPIAAQDAKPADPDLTSLFVHESSKQDAFMIGNESTAAATEAPLPMHASLMSKHKSVDTQLSTAVDDCSMDDTVQYLNGLQERNMPLSPMGSSGGNPANWYKLSQNFSKDDGSLMVPLTAEFPLPIPRKCDTGPLPVADYSPIQPV